MKIDTTHYTLGTVEASEQLINDLYIELRKKVNLWASVTHQTAQARMGYIGQHLVSVVTGFPGARSGARGKDLILSTDEFGEIKTCYRVDQLGKCKNCGEVVSPTEISCPTCKSIDLLRKEDSKWLIGIRHDEEFSEILSPKYYFLVLFEFTDLQNPTTIRSSIWRVDTTVPGFAYCMIDYYKNIRAKSKSKAPFNLWPYQLKFDLMRPHLIYRALITSDDNIETEIFPTLGNERVHILKPLYEYSRSQNLSKEKVVSFAKALGISVELKNKKADNLRKIQDFIEQNNVNSITVTDTLAEALYIPEIRGIIDGLPATIKERSGLYNA